MAFPPKPPVTAQGALGLPLWDPNLMEPTDVKGIPKRKPDPGQRPQPSPNGHFKGASDTVPHSPVAGSVTRGSLHSPVAGSVTRGSGLHATQREKTLPPFTSRIGDGLLLVLKNDRTAPFHIIAKAVQYVRELDRMAKSDFVAGLNDDTLVELKPGIWRDEAALLLLHHLDWETIFRRDRTDAKKLWLDMVERELNRKSYTLPVNNPALLKELPPEMLTQLIDECLDNIAGVVHILQERIADKLIRPRPSRFHAASLHHAHDYFHDLMQEARRLYDENPAAFPAAMETHLGDYENNIERYVQRTLILRVRFFMGMP